MQQIIFRTIITVLLVCSMFFVAHSIFFIGIIIAGLLIDRYYESLAVMTLFFIGFIYPAHHNIHYLVLMIPVLTILAQYLIRRYSTLYD